MEVEVSTKFQALEIRFEKVELDAAMAIGNRQENGMGLGGALKVQLRCEGHNNSRIHVDYMICASNLHMRAFT